MDKYIKLTSLERKDLRDLLDWGINDFEGRITIGPDELRATKKRARELRSLKNRLR